MSITFSRILRRSLLHRRARSLSALVALTVSAAVATALLTLYADLDAKLHKEFRSFGANIVATGSSLPADALSSIQQAAGTDAIAAPFGYAVATTDRGTSVVVAGTDLATVKKLDDWWQVTAWPSGENDALIGQRAADFIADEHDLKLTFAGKPIVLHGVGHLKTGGDEDSRIYMPLTAFTAWTGASTSVIEVQVPGGSAKVEAAISRIKQALPGIDVQPVRQLVEGESRIVDRTHALMYAAVLLIALTVGVSVLATLSASVLERRRDFALMKALGGTQLQLMLLFLLEALVLALAGVAVGFAVGSGAAFGISELNFHTATLPRLSVVPVVLLLNVLIATMAALFPARVLRGLQPAALLKGE
ncbi:ABC transporter permease [Granulicella arctica]|uniref:Putative ABC transport system permease protein n=1 Tax=Granulicella arctica TaxID=940613 RepID=A0A7Y9THX6_9BACT|nr:ABC transporter permease [Granulicella arctica]NYF80994.1 putative ABC transport system permease protein [Granulicella arctica]